MHRVFKAEDECYRHARFRPQRGDCQRRPHISDIAIGGRKSLYRRLGHIAVVAQPAMMKTSTNTTSVAKTDTAIKAILANCSTGVLASSR